MPASDEGFTATLTAEVAAEAQHPDRDLTPEERAHLGLPEESEK